MLLVVVGNCVGYVYDVSNDCRCGGFVIGIWVVIYGLINGIVINQDGVQDIVYLGNQVVLWYQGWMYMQFDVVIVVMGDVEVFDLIFEQFGVGNVVWGDFGNFFGEFFFELQGYFEFG